MNCNKNVRMLRDVSGACGKDGATSVFPGIDFPHLLVWKGPCTIAARTLYIGTCLETVTVDGEW